jgi:hypothetical protein
VNASGEWKGEHEDDSEVLHVTIADPRVVKIQESAFCGCAGLADLSFLENSSVTILGDSAFQRSGVSALLGMERVRAIGSRAFSQCRDLRSIEGLGCESMGEFCFASCTSLLSVEGWPASMTVIPPYCFLQCAGIARVGCDISRVTAVGYGAFEGCTSLLPAELSRYGARPAKVLAFLKRRAILERAPERRALLCSLRRDKGDYYNRTGDPCGASRRIIMEFAGLFPA